MELTVSQWGNSLAIRLPKAVAQAYGLTKGSILNGQIAKQGFTIKPISAMKEAEALLEGFDLQSLLNRITPENTHDFSEFDGPPVGKEVW